MTEETADSILYDIYCSVLGVDNYTLDFDKMSELWWLSWEKDGKSYSDCIRNPGDKTPVEHALRKLKAVIDENHNSRK